MGGRAVNAPAAHFDRDVLDEIRRRVSLEQLVARKVKLKRVGRGYGGLCPFHQEKTASFTVSDDKGFYHCFGCGAHGDIFRFVQETEGVDFAQAVRRLDTDGLTAIARSEASPPPGKVAKLGEVHDRVSSTTVGRWLWQTSVPARGELVEAWLSARGLDPLGVPGAIDQLRFHPDAPWSPWRVIEEPGTSWLRAPAMIAPMRDAGGLIRGVHATYLSGDGKSKARFPKTNEGDERVTRKMWGSLTGNAVWLAGFPGGLVGKLLVGEGIETVWAVAQALIANGQAVRAAAALSLDNLAGHPLRDKQGAVPLWNPQADHERPMFTVPDAGEVVVLVDADMKPIERLVQDRRGERREKRWLCALERAELCAHLATQHWTYAGASKVSAVRPKIGLDFNDAALAERRVA